MKKVFLGVQWLADLIFYIHKIKAGNTHQREKLITVDFHNKILSIIIKSNLNYTCQPQYDSNLRMIIKHGLSKLASLRAQYLTGEKIT